MITQADIKRRADAEGVTAQDIERDYVLAHAISTISKFDTGRKLVFKGGTSLRLIHFDNYRYSADLDFSVRSGTKEEAISLVEGAFQNRGNATPKLSLGKEDQLRIHYVGPLGKMRQVKLDLAIDELIVNTERKPILPYWDDVPPTEVEVYTLVEVTSEKLRCILQRMQCRDLFDLYILLRDERVDRQEAVELFRQKARHRDLNPDDFKDRYRTQAPRYEARWANELGNYMAEVPKFNEVNRRVRQVLRETKLL